MSGCLRILAAAVLGLCVPWQALAGGPGAGIAWQTRWNQALFSRAAQQRRFVLLDLHAVWCHWCHVMDATTYADPRVQSLIAAKFLPVSIDADSDPALSARYGDWGWPATIVLTPDGSEIVKRRGYIPAPQMLSLLQAIVEDPSPGPSVLPAPAIGAGGRDGLGVGQRAALLDVFDRLYDPRHGGWGERHKYLDAAAMELSFEQADQGDAEAARRARQTLDANLLLLDPVWGGVYQYSDALDWRSPHFEKLLSFQADDLRLYAEAAQRWDDARYRAAARSLRDYLLDFLRAPDGGFYVSQDADLSPTVDGHAFYALDDEARRAAGMPRIDTHEYARETGWAIRALCRDYELTGDSTALAAAEQAALWALRERALPGGGFRHWARDRAGPYLDDSIAMGEAFLALYRATGERSWLARATAALRFIDRTLRDPGAGYVAAAGNAGGPGVFREPVRRPEQNAALARLANLAWRCSGEGRYRRMALHALRYLSAYAAAVPGQFLPAVLLADGEQERTPIHIAVVGRRGDPAAQALHAAALRYPADYLQVEWLEPGAHSPGSGPVAYPRLTRAAAYACTGSSCSSPVFEPAGIEPAVRAALAQ